MEGFVRENSQTFLCVIQQNIPAGSTLLAADENTFKYLHLSGLKDHHMSCAGFQRTLSFRPFCQYSVILSNQLHEYTK